VPGGRAPHGHRPVVFSYVRRRRGPGVAGLDASMKAGVVGANALPPGCSEIRAATTADLIAASVSSALETLVAASAEFVARGCAAACTLWFRGIGIPSGDVAASAYALCTWLAWSAASACVVKQRERGMNVYSPGSTHVSSLLSENRPGANPSQCERPIRGHRRSESGRPLCAR
jgi:hypothetical protein